MGYTKEEAKEIYKQVRELLPCADIGINHADFPRDHFYLTIG